MELGEANEIYPRDQWNRYLCPANTLNGVVSRTINHDLYRASAIVSDRIGSDVELGEIDGYQDVGLIRALERYGIQHHWHGRK